MNSTEEIIRFHEGVERTVFRDTMGVLTGGIGHAFHVGTVVPDVAIYAFFKMDMEKATRLYHEMELDLDAVRRAAVINMCFNLGPQLKRWKFIERLREQNWIAAGDELKNSRWWYQVGRRGPDIWDMIVTGNWPKLNTR